MNETDDFAALLRQYEGTPSASTPSRPKVGDQVEGQVVAIQADQIYVDLGGKTEGLMETAGFLDDEGHPTIAVGDRIQARVAAIDADSGQLRLGVQAGRRFHDVAELEQAYRERRPVEGLVTGLIKGGVEVQMAGVRAFCPASQMDLRFVDDLSEFVGQHLAFQITQFDGGRRTNLVLSRRALLEEERQQQAAATRAQLEVGAVLEGTVTSIKDFGAFVDLGGIEGMIHISELAFGRVKHPSEVLSVGQPVTVSILRIEPSRSPRQPERVALSLRALAQDPWADAATRFPAGARAAGPVTRVEAFGAFVELEPGVEGLVHISELGAGRRIGHPNEVVKVGDMVTATVLAVDPAKRRIALSLAAAEAPDEPATRPEASEPKTSFGTFGDLLRASLDEKSGRQ